MRVALVCADSGPAASSAVADRIQHLGHQLVARGHDVIVFSRKWWDGDFTEYEWNDLTYRTVTDDASFRTRRFITRLPGTVHPFNPDLIHVCADRIGAVNAASLGSLLLRCPLIAEWYTYTPRTGWEAFAQKLAVRAPRTVITPSRLIQTGVRELGRSPETIEVIPNSIDFSAIQSIDPEHIADIVYPRRLDGDANLESLFLALAELRQSDWQLAIIGAGPSKSKYQQHAADLRIDDQVTFIGDIDDDRRVAIYKGAHVAVHTALRSPFPTEFLHALACGCIGIAEYHMNSSAHELLEGWDRGIRTTDEAALADAIREAATMEHREIDNRFQAYDINEITDRYLDCYRAAGAVEGQ